MFVTTFEGLVEKRRVRLPEGIVLPEQQTVFVVVPSTVPPTTKK